MIRKLARCWFAILRKSRLPISCERESLERSILD